MKLKTALILISSIILSSCSPEATKLYVKPTLEKTNVTVDPNAQYFDPSVDILFVIDNSGSMGAHQTNLASNVQLFVNEFSKNSVLNYHIGVVTTDMDPCMWGGSNPIPGTCGLLFGSPTFVERSTPNMISALQANMMPGSGGSYQEQLFAPVSAALKTNNQTGYNKGFYRASAPLAIIFITDTEDQSDNLSAKQLYNELLNLKGGDARKILAYGVFIPTKEMNNCTGEGMVPAKIEEFLGLVVNASVAPNQFSLCDPNFGKHIADIGKNIVSQVGTIFYLKDLPDTESIKVTYGSAILPKDRHKGWMYDSSQNAVILGDDIDWASQPSGSKVMVTYDLANVPGGKTK